MTKPDSVCHSLPAEHVKVRWSDTETSPDIGWIDRVLLPVVADMLLLDIPFHRFPHVVGILAGTRGVGGVVAVVVLDDAEDAVAHALVEGDGLVVGTPHKQIDEPGIVGIGGDLELLAQQSANSKTTSFWGHSNGGDVGMPR